MLKKPVLSMAFATLLTLACHSGEQPAAPSTPAPSQPPVAGTPPPAPPATPSPSPSTSPSAPPSTPAHTDFSVALTVNGYDLGSFDCGKAMSLSTTATNRSGVPVDLRRLTIRFTPLSGQCHEHVATIDPTLDVRLPGTGTRELRRFDASGDLCQEPDGVPGCTWRAQADVHTDAGAVRDQITLATFSSAKHCGVVPQLTAPVDGAVVSGVVDVQASIVEGDGCVITARSVIEGFSAHGSLVFRSGELDLGDAYRWDTRSLPEGRYWITAYQNCCRIRSAPTVVRVRH